MAEPVEPLKSQDAIKTYRYLRIGMIGAVVLLAASIAVERGKVDCWQTSISAYYYTPVRAIFVGSLLAVGLSLLVYKGRRLWEDACLNAAGMLAPVVAIAPTTDVGTCWSVAPSPRPVNDDGTLATWVVTNIDNNFHALLMAGGIGLLVASMIAVAVTRSVRVPVQKVEPGTGRALFATAIALVLGLVLIRTWDDFNTRAHGLAAVLMFGFLIAAIAAKVWEGRQEREKFWFWSAGVAALMIMGGVIIWLTRVFEDHTVFALETWEIVLFGVYWSIQTRENWDEEVVGSKRG